MKAGENETVADVVKRVRRECNSYPLPTASAEMLKLVREIEAAHNREVEELKKKCEEYERQPELMAETAKEALELLKAQESKIAELRGERTGLLRANESLAADNDRLRRAVAELCKCLKEAIDTIAKSQGGARRWKERVMATKPIVQVSCSTCSHNKTEFGFGCSIGRDRDEREHGFCPAWNLSSKAREIALIDFAWKNGLDKSRIRSKSCIDWFKKEQEYGK